jgi:hypothetical protein
MNRYVVAILVAVFLYGCATAPKNVQPSFAYTKGITDTTKLALLRGTIHQGNILVLSEHSGVCGVDDYKEKAYLQAYIFPGERKVCLRASPYSLNALASTANDGYVEYHFEPGKIYDIKFTNNFTSYSFTIVEAE